MGGIIEGRSVMAYPLEGVIPIHGEQKAEGELLFVLETVRARWATVLQMVIQRIATKGDPDTLLNNPSHCKVQIVCDRELAGHMCLERDLSSHSAQ